MSITEYVMAVIQTLVAMVAPWAHAVSVPNPVRLWPRPPPGDKALEVVGPTPKPRAGGARMDHGVFYLESVTC